MQEFPEILRSNKRLSFLSLFDINELKHMATGLDIAKLEQIEIRTKSKYGYKYKSINRASVETIFDFEWNKKIFLAMKAQIFWHLHNGVSESSDSDKVRRVMMQGLTELFDIEELRIFTQSTGINIAVPPKRPFQREIKQSSRAQITSALMKYWDEFDITDKILRELENGLVVSSAAG